MGEIDDIIQRYKEVRQRLRYPPNAVPDAGIDLKRKPPPPTIQVPLSQPKTENPEIQPSPPLILGPLKGNACLTFSSTLEITAREFGLEPKQMWDKSRKQNICLPRQVAFYIANTKLGKPKNWIGKYMGMDHTTVLNAKRKVERRIEIDPEFKDKIENIEAKLEDRITSTISSEHQSHLAEEQDGSLPLGSIFEMDQGGGSTLCYQQERTDPEDGGAIHPDLGASHDGQTSEA